jgi:hypothetical protein
MGFWSLQLWDLIAIATELKQGVEELPTDFPHILPEN